MHKPLLLFASALALAGCAGQIVSDERIRDNTAEALGVQPASVTISGRESDGISTTRYAARTPHGTYDCLFHGGTLLSLGVANRPMCDRSASR